MALLPTSLSVMLIIATLLTVQTGTVTLHKGVTKNDETPPQTPPLKVEHPFSVDCPDRKKSCECPEVHKECKFSLTAEELQTFTSYKLVNESCGFLNLLQERIKTKGTIRTTAGDTYYLDGHGYTPALPPREVNRPPEYGKCYLDNQAITAETFAANSCSVPITVDGATFRMIIGVNGQMPGPTLIVYRHQKVRIRVTNKLTSEGISVHWHGMHQKHTPWMDGVGLVSQPPIPPGAHFDYVFDAFPSGTHWYHSHIGAQRTDGLYGALIVREPTSNRPHETEYTKDWGCRLVDEPDRHTISLLDWQSESSLNLFVRIHSTLGYFPKLGVGRVPTQQDSLYLRTHSADGIEVGPVPYWSGLINGQGRHDDNTFSVLSTFQVEAGTSYRFRLIGAQSLYAFKFSIDDHKLHLMASDGQFVERVTVDYIIIHSGERYDFILRTKEVTGADGNYWMRAETLEADTTERHSAEGILHYAGAEPLTATNKYTNVPVRRRKCSQHRPCVAVNCPFKAFPREENTICVHLDQLSAKYFTTEQRQLPKILPASDKENLKFFNFGFEGMRSTSAINSMNFKLPTTPYQTYCDQYREDREEGGIVCDGDEPSNFQECVNVAQIATSAEYADNAEEYPSVNFVLSAVGDICKKNNNFSHPIHLHGHTFYVVAVRHGEYNSLGKLDKNNVDVDCHDEACHSPSWTDGTLPRYLRWRDRVRPRAIRKDTVIVPAGGYVVIAFEADNPGYWFMHCHIEAHQLEGMAVIVQEYPSLQQWTPPTGINRIGNFDWSIDQFNASVTAGLMCSIKSNT